MKARPEEGRRPGDDRGDAAEIVFVADPRARSERREQRGEHFAVPVAGDLSDGDRVNFEVLTFGHPAQGLGDPRGIDPSGAFGSDLKAEIAGARRDFARPERRERVGRVGTQLHLRQVQVRQALAIADGGEGRKLHAATDEGAVFGQELVEVRSPDGVEGDASLGRQLFRLRSMGERRREAVASGEATLQSSVSEDPTESAVPEEGERRFDVVRVQVANAGAKERAAGQHDGRARIARKVLAQSRKGPARDAALRREVGFDEGVVRDLDAARRPGRLAPPQGVLEQAREKHVSVVETVEGPYARDEQITQRHLLWKRRRPRFQSNGRLRAWVGLDSVEVLNAIFIFSRAGSIR